MEESNGDDRHNSGSRSCAEDTIVDYSARWPDETSERALHDAHAQYSVDREHDAHSADQSNASASAGQEPSAHPGKSVSFAFPTRSESALANGGLSSNEVAARNALGQQSALDGAQRGNAERTQTAVAASNTPAGIVDTPLIFSRNSSCDSLASYDSSQLPQACHPPFSVAALLIPSSFLVQTLLSVLFLSFKLLPFVLFACLHKLAMLIHYSFCFSICSLFLILLFVVNRNFCC